MDGTCLPHGCPNRRGGLHSCSYWACAYCSLNTLCPSFRTPSGKSMGVYEHLSLPLRWSDRLTGLLWRERGYCSFLRSNRWVSLGLPSGCLGDRLYLRTVSGNSFLRDSQRHHGIVTHLWVRSPVAQDRY